MLNNRLNSQKLKPFLLMLAVAFLAYRVGKTAPNIMTISLGTWMEMTFYIAPALLVLILIALWNPSQQSLSFNRLKVPSASMILTGKFLLYSVVILFISALAVLWIIAENPTYIMVGHVVFIGSLVAMFFIGAMKPELGPIVFFTIYPFLWFAEGRLNSSLYWFLKDVPYLPEWVQSILIDSNNIHIVMLMFMIGFLFFIINNLKSVEKTVLDNLILLFLGWVFLSVVTANDRLVALEYFFKKWLFPISFYYATLFTIRRKNGIREIMIALVALLLFSCLLNIQNAVLTDKFAAIQLGKERAMIWTIIAYQMGPWTLLILPLSLTLFFDRKEETYVRLFSFFSIILALTMAFWEMQRAIIVGLGFMLVLSFIFYPHRRRRIFVMLGILGIVMLLSFTKLIELVNLMRPSLLQGNPFGTESSLDRLYLWEQSWNIIKNNPILGIGPGGFKALQIGLYFPETNSHNMFIELALESGILASILLSIILFYPIIRGARSFFDEKYITHGKDLKPLIISLVGYYLYIMLGVTWHYGESAAAFCMFGVLIGANTRRPGRDVRSGVKRIKVGFQNCRTQKFTPHTLDTGA
jgi:O-antigen ligase